MMKDTKLGIIPYDSSRRQKNNIDLIDRISTLPDSILGHILTLLPTKNAIATSILSKRWKFAWVTVHNLDFYFNGLNRNESENMKFVLFVDRVLLLHDHDLINRFILNWKFNCPSFQSHVMSWINIIITRNVHELCLRLVNYDGSFGMPTSVFSCESLQTLELEGIIFASESIAGCFPRLKRLKLDSVELQSEETLEKLISGCPMLNYLYLNIYFEEGFMIIISSVSLRRLECHFVDYYGLNLNAISLEYLKVSGFVPNFFVTQNLSSLVEADFRILVEDFYGDLIVGAVRAFDCAKILSLSSDVMLALSNSTISLSTEFKRLVKLEIDASDIDWNVIQYFIQNTDNLEVLILYQVGSDETKVDTYPWQVPRCLLNKLKKVISKGYCGYKNEREIIQYILNNGCVLEVMEIYWIDAFIDSEKLKLVEEICKFSRRSAAAQVTFHSL